MATLPGDPTMGNIFEQCQQQYDANYREQLLDTNSAANV